MVSKASAFALSGEVEKRLSIISPQKPHLLIRNTAFRHFWGTFVSPSDSIRRISFFAKLSMTLTAAREELKIPHSSTSPTSPGNDNNDGSLDSGERNGKKSDKSNDSMPILPYGYGLSEAEIILLLRGAPKGFLDEIMTSLDLDETGIITNIKLDIATSSIPFDTSLRDTLLFLAHQGGRKVALPAHVFDSTEMQIKNVLKNLQPTIAPPSYSKNALGELVQNYSDGKPSASLVDFVPILSIFLLGGNECPDDNTQKNILEMMGRTFGWNVLVGEPSVGKTIRVITAGRTFLANKIREQNEKREKNPNEKNRRRAISRKFVPYDDPNEHNDKNNNNQKNLNNPNGNDMERNIAQAPSSVLYVDLSGCRTRFEVVASLGGQLGVGEGGGVGCAEECEQRVTRMLGMFCSLRFPFYSSFFYLSPPRLSISSRFLSSLFFSFLHSSFLFFSVLLFSSLFFSFLLFSTSLFLSIFFTSLFCNPLPRILHKS